MAGEMKDLVLVTGATGYLASCLVKQLADSGEYRLRCTVRSLENNKKLDTLKQVLKDSKTQPEFVKADLLQSAELWKGTVAGCDYVLHTASPFPMGNPSNADDIIKPAVDGTLSVLRACAESGTVKRIVITSSCAAIYPGNPATKEPLTEKTWANLESIESPYAKSKALAEKAAWDFVKELPESKKIELVTLNPGFVIGPPVMATSGTSMTTCQSILTGEWPMVPKLGYPAVDVRDVVQAHITAIKCPQAAGHRHILASGFYWMKDIANILADEFNSKGYKVSREEAPGSGDSYLLDNSRMRNVLKIEPRPFKESVLDMANKLIELGLVSKQD